MLTLTSPLTHLPGIGATTAKKLAKLKLTTGADLLWHLPSRYDDFSKTVAIENLRVGEPATVRARLQLIKSRRSWKRKLSITEALVSDGTGSLKCIWFNQPYLATTLMAGDELFLSGVLQQSSYGLQLDHPTYEPVKGLQLHTGRLVPHYPLTAGLTPRLLRQLIAKVLPLATQETDWLPAVIQKKFQLTNLPNALHWIHFPPDYSKVLAARQRLAFDELFLLRVRAVVAKSRYHQNKSPLIPFNEATTKFVAELPWPLTDDQKRAAWQIIKDLGQPEPMNRLVQGDVGSGKTVVAGIAALNAILAGYQVVLLAPTEILAEQHFNTLTQLFSKWPLNLGLFTRSHCQLSSITHQQRQSHKLTKAALTKQLAAGKINFAIGTHALLTSSVALPKLGLLIVDEQHRFGVLQRQALTLKTTPHFLSLSATPIPRSLALTIYGDLDISLIKQLPQGRQPITTKIIPPPERASAYDLMRKEIKLGNRVFIICPLIEESDLLGVRAVTAEQERLSQEVFPDLNLGLLHGKLAGSTKAEVMTKFKTGETPILVATSVVEVGIDVPEATVIAIEGAERFGLAQLHQLRGRVGRSHRASYCLLLTDSSNPTSDQRLQALVNYQSGFDLAEQDLNQRGPGDLLGSLQTGWPSLKIASLADSGLLEKVREAAAWLLEQNPTLTRYPELIKKANASSFHPE